MSDEITEYNPDQVMQNVRDKIKATFADLIPDEHWNKLIENEINVFIKSSEDRYGNKAHSELRILVHEEARAFCKEKIKEILKEDERFQGYYDKDGNYKSVSEALEKILVKRAPEIFFDIISGAVGEIISNMSNRF